MCFLTNNFRCCFSIKANSTFLAARTEETLSGLNTSKAKNTTLSSTLLIGLKVQGYSTVVNQTCPSLIESILKETAIRNQIYFTTCLMFISWTLKTKNMRYIKLMNM